MVSPLQSLRNLRAHHGVSDRRGIRHWWLLVSVFVIDMYRAAVLTMERPFLWSLNQLPDGMASKIARRYKVVRYW